MSTFLRPLASAVLASALVGVGLSSPAAAAPGDNLADLQLELSSCTGTLSSPTLIVLTTDLSGTGTTLGLGCHARIDLNGNDLTVARMVVPLGLSLDVTDSTSSGPAGRLTADASADPGSAGIQIVNASFSTHGRAQVTAYGGFQAAGIGGPQFDDGGITESHDISSITAVGGMDGAGIGGGYGGVGGITVSHDNSAITATGGPNGAGIGGGSGDEGGTTASRDNSTISATGGVAGAGIGGGLGAPGGTTTVVSGTVTAVPGVGADPVGAGAGGVGGGPLRVTGGMLRLPSGTQTVPAASTTASPLFEIGEGAIVAGGSPTSATIAGTGVLVNHGSLVLPTANVTAPVSDHHYDLTFDLQGGSGSADPVTVFASTFVDGDRSLPTPARAGYTFLGWNTAADGSGDAITGGSTLPGASTDGTGVAITAYALWTSLPDDLAGCTDGASFALTFDVSLPNRQLTVACDAQIDLAGHDLAVRNIVVNGGESLDVTDTSSGGPAGQLVADASSSATRAGIRNTGATFTTHGRAVVTAVGGELGAGIGGADGGAGGTTTSNDTSTISASGGYQAAGIGGGARGTGGTTTSNDSSTITATGGDEGAGIGGGDSRPGGTTTSNDGSSITATGGFRGAGVGGGDGGAGGTTTTAGASTLSATGGTFGAGIGGGNGRAGGTTTIEDASSVSAAGGTHAAGIGGGANGSGGTTTTQDTSLVTALGGSAGSAIGGGEFGNGGSTTVAGGSVVALPGGSADPVGRGEVGTDSGALTVSGGTLRLPDGTQRVEGTGSFEIGTGGRVTGGPATSAILTGTGVLANHGALTMATADVGATLVSDRHYRVTFDLNGGSGVTPAAVTVYADTFANGARTFPSDTPTRPGYTFEGWNTAADGSGDEITDTSTLPGSSSTGSAVAITAYAEWSQVPGPPARVPVPAPVIANTTSSERGTANPRVGDTLAVVDPVSGVGYSWQHDGTSTPLGSQTSYTLTEADAGSSIVVVASAVALPYEGTAMSAPTGIVLLGGSPAPEVAISGKPRVGKPLRAVPSGVDGLELTWQWETQIPGSTDWTPVPGATTDSFTPTAAQLRHLVRVTVTTTSPGEERASATSAATAPVAKGRLPKPERLITIRGQRHVGDVVRLVNLGRYFAALPDDAGLRVSWYAGGNKIRNATFPTYTLDEDTAGKRLRVRITVTAPGYRTLRFMAFRSKG